MKKKEKKSAPTGFYSGPKGLRFKRQGNERGDLSLSAAENKVQSVREKVQIHRPAHQFLWVAVRLKKENLAGTIVVCHRFFPSPSYVTQKSNLSKLNWYLSSVLATTTACSASWKEDEGVHTGFRFRYESELFIDRVLPLLRGQV